MKATHTDYLHPKHLRVEDGNRVLCMSPNAKAYPELNRSNLPSYRDENKPPNLKKCKLFQARSKVEIERKLDAFLAEEKSFKDVPLILTADGQSCRHTYKRITIREWHYRGNVRFDSAIELL